MLASYSFTRGDLVLSLTKWLDDSYQCIPQVLEQWAKPQHLLVPPVPLIPSKDAYELCAIAASVTQQPLLLAKLVSREQRDAYTFYRRWMMGAPTLGLAISKGNWGFNRIIQTGGRLMIKLPLQARSVWQYTPSGKPIAGYQQEVLVISSLMVAVIKYFADDLANSGEIHLALASPPAGKPNELAELLGVEVTWRADVTQISFPAQWIPLANPRIEPVPVPNFNWLDTIVQMPDEHDQLRNLYELLVYAMAIGKPSLKFLADELAMSDRTLQRYLKRQGFTFTSFTNTVRTQVAFRLLSYPHSIDFVANRLGFENRGQFSRQFHKWCGTSPQDFQARLTQNKPTV